MPQSKETPPKRVWVVFQNNWGSGSAVEWPPHPRSAMPWLNTTTTSPRAARSSGKSSG